MGPGEIWPAAARQVFRVLGFGAEGLLGLGFRVVGLGFRGFGVWGFRDLGL